MLARIRLLLSVVLAVGGVGLGLGDVLVHHHETLKA
ncbi:hypothetical protein CHELA40_11113 [Chelatococcus asaccharovorans]|nr:hypothetical protein CHELA40_11113 [Chelatococcus asaccharovorans]CAH1685397.1 hypothetical protein CHELA17_64486 [Chelatococcus asaccharovorans]